MLPPSMSCTNASSFPSGTGHKWAYLAFLRLVMVNLDLAVRGGDGIAVDLERARERMGLRTEKDRVRFRVGLVGGAGMLESGLMLY
jgi:hypothetical protein